MNITQKKRIRIYTNVRRSLELAKNIYEKHKSDGDQSPLSLIEGFSWEATAKKINFCLEKHEEAIQISKNADEIYRQRDAVLAEITDIIMASKLLLKNKYVLNPEKISEWGFELYDISVAAETKPP